MNAHDTTTRSARIEERAMRRFRQDHTPAPWTCDPEGRITGFDGCTIAACAMHLVYRADDHRMHANANHIVKCVNVHDDLLEACHVALHAFRQRPDREKTSWENEAWPKLQAAIAKTVAPVPVAPPEFHAEPEDYGQADSLAKACDGELELND